MVGKTYRKGVNVKEKREEEGRMKKEKGKTERKRR